MAKYLNLSIPQACNENWAAMVPGEKGNFCSSCKKSVIDFTGMPDSKLAEFLKSGDDRLCGRFYTDQLNREIAVPKKQLPLVKYFFTVTIPALLYSSRSLAQQKTTMPDTEQTDIKHQPMVLGKFISRKLLSGRIVDQSGMPIAGASVTVLHTKTGVAADAEGKFKLYVNAGADSITVSAAGYKMSEVKISGKDSLNITLQEDTRIMMGMMVVVRSPKKVKPAVPAKKEQLIKVAAEKNEITLFPNPVAANSGLTVSWKNKIAGEQSVEIFSGDGNLVQAERLSSFAKTDRATVYLKDLPAGFYIIRVTDLKTAQILSKEFIVK